LNLEVLQIPLEAVIYSGDMADSLSVFDEHYQVEYRRLMLKNWVFLSASAGLRGTCGLTIQLLQETQVGYHDFFSKLTQMFSPKWREDINLILNCLDFLRSRLVRRLRNWCNLYQQILSNLP